jgi:GNAT superfamily N-acetyltransferase
MGMALKKLDLTFEPVTPARWRDFEALFGENGACGGCWCMWWRSSHAEFEKNKGEGNKRAMRRLVGGGVVPGLLAYHQGEAVGWCSVAPRADFPRLARSRLLEPVDDRPVWSITCFFVRRDYRRRGVSTRLIEAAVDYVRSRGGGILEAYPKDGSKHLEPDAFVWNGLFSAFRKARFEEVARRSRNRPIVRRVARPAAGGPKRRPPETREGRR